MKRWLLGLVMVAWSGSGLAASEDAKTRCEQIREQMKQGVKVEIWMEAIDLFDATQRRQHSLGFLLIPNVFDRCIVSEDPMGHLKSVYFEIGKDAQLKTARATYSAVWNASYPHVNTQLNDSELLQLNGDKLTAYHAVFASIMRELGYETFESASGSPFPSLVEQVFFDIPSNNQASGLVGVGGMSGRLYQIMVKRVGIMM